MPDTASESEWTELEDLLRSFTPSSAGLNRDRLFFELGRASAKSGKRLDFRWPHSDAVRFDEGRVLGQRDVSVGCEPDDVVARQSDLK